MSDAASPCPDGDPAVTPAPATAESQLAGIRELVRIAELQARAYAQDAEAAAGSAESGESRAGPAASALPPRAAAVPRQATASDPESSTVTEHA